MKGRQKKSHEVAEFQRRVLKERRGERVGIDAIPLERFNRIRLSSRPSSIVLFSALLKEGRFIDIRNFRWLKRKKNLPAF